MKRFHVHVAVEDLTKSINFYSTLFGTEPSVVKADYAKWMLEDPKVNFAISRRGEWSGVDHLGIQVENDDELRELSGRLKTAGERTRDEEAITCCYAQGNKTWVYDPTGVRWETFFTFGEATTYGDVEAMTGAANEQAASACCAPAPKASACCGEAA